MNIQNPDSYLLPPCFLCRGDTTEGIIVRNGDGSFVRVCSGCQERHWREFYRENGIPTEETQAGEVQGLC